MKKNNFILIFLTIFNFNVFASDGDLDTTFNPSGPLPGTNTNSFPPNIINFASGIAIMNDGSLILAGSTGNFPDFAIAKYTSTGILDSSFGGGDGLVTTIFPGNTSQASDVQITSDSKIVAIGATTTFQRFALAKYESNGNLDTSFGGGTGLVITEIVAGSSFDVANAGVILSDGKIIAVGRSTLPGTQFVALAKYNTDGTLDEGFTNSSSVGSPILGTIRLDISGSSQASEGLDVITQTVEGVERILVTGSVQVNTQSYFLARFNLDGSFDTSFGNNGIVIDKFEAVGASVANTVTLQNDKIIVGGSTTSFGASLGGFARYDFNGQLDSTFGTNGKVITTLLNDVEAIKVMSDLKIVAVGNTSLPLDFSVVRLTIDGSFDSTFANDGLRAITFPGFASGQAFDVVIQPDLKIVAVGRAYNGLFIPSNFAIARLLGKTSTFVNILEPSQNEVVKTNNVNFRIQTDPGNSVRLEVDSIVRTGTADENGLFEVIINLSNGSYNVRVTVEDAAENTASASVSFSVAGENCTLPADQLTLAIREKYGS